MKRNILSGIILISALALSSCSTTKLASNQLKDDDDVYTSNAKAGDAPEYIAQQKPATQDRYNTYADDDYYYYNSYSSRINRFGYFSPFGYYNDFYYGYNSPYGSYYNSYYGTGFGLSLGYGYGAYYGNPYYGYFGSGYYSPYSYWGTGYGYGYGGYYGGGGGGYWGGYSAYGNSGSPRPYRGSGSPSNSLVNRSTRPVGYNGSYPVSSEYPGRPTVNGSGGRQAVNSNGTSYNPNGGNTSRPVRSDAPNNSAPRPTYQPQSVSQPAPSNSGSSSSSGGGSSSSSGGGGGGSRPVRP